MFPELVTAFLADPEKVNRTNLRSLLQLKHQVGEAIKVNALDTTITADLNGQKLASLQTQINLALARHTAEEGPSYNGRATPFGHVTEGDSIPGVNGQRKGQGFLSRLMANGSTEVREQIEGLLALMSGRTSALANMSPTGDGGNLIPQFVANQIEMHVAAFTPVFNVSRIWNTEDGAPAVYPVLSDSESAEQLASEALTGLDDVVSGDTPPTALTGPKLGAYKLSSKPVLLPRELTTDTGLDIAGDILSALIARIARYENLKYTRGNGTTEAQGFVTACTHYEVTTPLDFDMTRDLTQQVEPLYRPNGVFMMSDGTAKYLRAIKTGLSGDKRTIWEDRNQQSGQPATLHGYPVYINNDLPDVASNGYIAGHEVCFGDFSRYVIRRAENGIPFVYSWPVPAKDGRALIAFRRTDAKLLVSTAIASLSVGGS